VNTSGARAGEGARGSRATDGTAAVSLGSKEADTGAGAEAGGGTDAAVSTGGARAGVGAAGATAAVSLGSEEAGTGAGAEAGGGHATMRNASPEMARHTAVLRLPAASLSDQAAFRSLIRGRSVSGSVSRSRSAITSVKAENSCSNFGRAAWPRRISAVVRSTILRTLATH
jgi:hypothetical protein